MAFMLVGLLWLFVALGLFFMPGASAERRRTREGLPDFWRRSANYAFPLDYVVRALFCLAYALWLFPATHPGWGVAGGFFMLLLSALAT